MTKFKPIACAWSRACAVAAALLVGSSALSLAGCGSDEGSAAGADGSEESVAVLEVDAPLRAPTLGLDEEEIFALRQDGSRLVKVDVPPGGFTPDVQRSRAVTLTEELDGAAGENLVLEKGRTPDKIYVPVPDQDEVFVLEKDDMLEVRTFEAGESPSRVALDRAPGTLLALSKDGSTVTAVDLVLKEVSANIEVNGGENSLIEAGAGDGFWVTGPETLAFYDGPSFERQALLKLDAAALAANAEEERAYAAEAGSGRVVAVKPGQGGDREVIAEAEVDGRVRRLEAEAGRLYALTPARLLVLDPESLRTLDTVEFDRFLGREALRRAEPSGLTIGEDSLYLTLEGESFLVQIEKP